MSRIVAYGGAGNDWIQVANTVTVPVSLLGGAGTDTLIAGGGLSLLLGGDGIDLLQSGIGRSILIGGKSADTLKSGKGDSMLIPGTTDYDANDLALAGLLVDWNATAGYAARVTNLGSRLNGSTVHDDKAADTLQGGPGLRWFFANLNAAPMRDSTVGVKKSEVVTKLFGS